MAYNIFLQGITNVIEMAIVLSYIGLIFKYKRSKLFISLFSIGCYAVLTTVYVLANNGILNLITTIIINILIFYICYQSTFKTAMFHSVILEIILLFSEIFSIFILSVLFKQDSTFDISSTPILTLEILLSKVFFFFISHFLAKLATKKRTKESFGKWTLLSVMPISSALVIILAVMLIRKYNIEFDNLTGILSVIMIALLLVSNIIVYIVYERAQEDNARLTELEIIDQREKINSQYLEILEKKRENTRKVAHDYKKHLEMINSLSDSDEVHKYIDSLYDDIKKYESIGQSHNKLLDVILNKYASVCESKSIKLRISIVSENLSFMDNTDLSKIMNNLFDNAIEACEKSANPFIELEITNSSRTYAKIYLKNSSDVRPIEKEGLFESAKADYENHGYGLKIIKSTTQNYNGEIKMDYDEKLKVFSTSIFIPHSK